MDDESEALRVLASEQDSCISERDEIRALVRSLLVKLSVTDRKALRMRVGLPPFTRPHSYMDMAKRLGMTHEGARQCFLRALRRARRVAWPVQEICRDLLDGNSSVPQRKVIV